MDVRGGNDVSLEVNTDDLQFQINELALERFFEETSIPHDVEWDEDRNVYVAIPRNV